MEGFVEGMDKIAKKGFRLPSRFTKSTSLLSKLKSGGKRAGHLLSGKPIAEALKKKGLKGGAKQKFLARKGAATPSQIAKSKRGIRSEALKSGGALAGAAGAAGAGALGLRELLKKKKEKK